MPAAAAVALPKLSVALSACNCSACIVSESANNHQCVTKTFENLLLSIVCAMKLVLCILIQCADDELREVRVQLATEQEKGVDLENKVKELEVRGLKQHSEH